MTPARVGIPTPPRTVAEFIDHLRQGKLTTTRCGKCGLTQFPPSAHCCRCGASSGSWVELQGRGTLHSFTTICAAPAGFESRAPYLLGVVDLHEGPRALAWFESGTGEQQLCIGMAVRLVVAQLDPTDPDAVTYVIRVEPRAANSSAEDSGAPQRGGV